MSDARCPRCGYSASPPACTKCGRLFWAEFDWLTRVSKWATDGRDSRIYTMFCDLDEQHGRHEHLVRGRRCECPGANRERGWVVRLGSYLRIFGPPASGTLGYRTSESWLDTLIDQAKEREFEFGSAVSAKETLGG